MYKKCGSRKAIIADLSGVLVSDGLADIRWLGDRYGVDGEGLNYAKDRIWVDSFSVDPNMASYSFWDKIFREVGLELDPDEIRRINSTILGLHEPSKRMLDFFRGFNGHPVRRALLTNNSREWLEYHDRALGLGGMFHYVVAPYNEDGLRKPGVEIISRTLEKLDCDRVIGIDDQARNVDAMARAGVDYPILHESDEKTIKELKNFLRD